MIAIDTHVLIWTQISPERLSNRAVEAINRAKVQVIPSICLWEVSLLVELGRINLRQPLFNWLVAACKAPEARVQQITPSIAARCAELRMHRDPADRLIVATSSVLDLPLLTADQKIHDLGLINTIW